MRHDAGVFPKESRAPQGPQIGSQAGVSAESAFGLVRQIVSRLRSACEMLETLNSSVDSGPPRDRDKAAAEPSSLIGLLQEALNLTDAVNREANTLAGKIGE